MSIFVESCSIDYRGQWPVGMPDSDLTWNPNAKDGQSGPKYRLFSQKDVRAVLPNTYTNVSNNDMSLLLIFVITTKNNKLFIDF